MQELLDKDILEEIQLEQLVQAVVVVLVQQDLLVRHQQEVLVVLVLIGYHSELIMLAAEEVDNGIQTVQREQAD